jgi:hypothetical protein
MEVWARYSQRELASAPSYSWRRLSAVILAAAIEGQTRKVTHQQRGLGRDPSSGEWQNVTVEKVAFGSGQKQYRLSQLSPGSEPAGGNLGEPLPELFRLAVGVRHNKFGCRHMSERCRSLG